MDLWSTKTRNLPILGRDALATALPIFKYFLRKGKPEKITQTIWVVGDLNTKESRDLLKNALTFMVNYNLFHMLLLLGHYLIIIIMFFLVTVIYLY